MKNQIYNQEAIRSEFFEYDNLSEIIIALEKKYSSQGDVICQFIVNDLVLDESDEVRLGTVTTNDISKIEVKFEQPLILLQTVIENWIVEIPRLIDQVDQLSQILRNKGLAGDYRLFVALIDNCQFLIDSLLSVDQVMRALLPDQRSVWIQNEERLAQTIGKTLEAFEKQDTSELADLFEYDLANSLQSWFDLLKEVQSVLRDEQSRDAQKLSDRIFRNRVEL